MDKVQVNTPKPQSFQASVRSLQDVLISQVPGCDFRDHHKVISCIRLQTFSKQFLSLTFAVSLRCIEQIDPITDSAINSISNVAACECRSVAPCTRPKLSGSLPNDRNSQSRLPKRCIPHSFPFTLIDNRVLRINSTRPIGLIETSFFLRRSIFESNSAQIG